MVADHRNYLKFPCAVHGYIKLDPVVKLFIDSKAGQRLRNLAQLGCAPRVFPTANHTRFDHSLGVAHLAGKFYRRLCKNSPNRLKYNEHHDKLLQLAGENWEEFQKLGMPCGTACGATIMALGKSNHSTGRGWPPACGPCIHIDGIMCPNSGYLYIAKQQCV